MLENDSPSRKGSSIKSGLKPIILQHGLLDSSDTWLINDEDKAPGFIFANANYDVWFGNSRGNKHARQHKTLNPDKDAKFWEFSFQ
jgi:gastric triacylglycerol lipase